MSYNDGEWMPGLAGLRSFTTHHHHVGYHFSPFQTVSFQHNLVRSYFLSSEGGWPETDENNTWEFPRCTAFFESQITSKCSSSAERQEITLREAAAHLRREELVRPWGSLCQWTGPRGCHCLGGRLDFTPSQPSRRSASERGLPPVWPGQG